MKEPDTKKQLLKEADLHLDIVDGEVDGLLAGADVVGDDVGDEGVFGPARAGSLLRETEKMA